LQLLAAFSTSESRDMLLQDPELLTKQRPDGWDFSEKIVVANISPAMPTWWFGDNEFVQGDLERSKSDRDLVLLLLDDKLPFT
jgi:hypothetical protein